MTSDALDLTVKFGNQTRPRCPDCRCFMGQSGKRAKCGRCGRSFDQNVEGNYIARGA